MGSNISRFSYSLELQKYGDTSDAWFAMCSRWIRMHWKGPCSPMAADRGGHCCPPLPVNSSASSRATPREHHRRKQTACPPGRP